MAKVHNANHEIVCVVNEEDGSIIIQARGCRTVLKPDKPVKYEIKVTKK